MRSRSTHGKEQFLGVVRPIQSIVSHYSVQHSKKINNGINCDARDKRGHSVLNNSKTCDAAFCHDSLTTCFLFSSTNSFIERRVRNIKDVFLVIIKNSKMRSFMIYVVSILGLVIRTGAGNMYIPVDNQNLQIFNTAHLASTRLPMVS